jgi:di/tripeptidase
LKNFRNYEEQKIELNENVNVFYGNNAQGKTNVLEALYFCALGRSFRTHKESELINFKDSYSNMSELINKDPRCIDKALAAIKALGLTPNTSPIRGGTDGARLTYMGLNCPNLGTGGYNCHGPYEMACLEEMEQVVQILIEITKAS